LDGPPEYNKETNNQQDTVDVPFELDSSKGNVYHTLASRKHSNRLNGLVSKANFISCCVPRLAAWRQHFSRITKSMNLKILPLTPGYNATQWNAEFDSLNRLVKARKVVNKLLADDLELINANKRCKGSQKPCGYFHKIFFTPDDWTALEELTMELSTQTQQESITQPATSDTNQPASDNLFNLFKLQGAQVQFNEIAAYLKGTHPMSPKDNAQENKAVLPWWKVI
ncbi:hypothetical protein DFH28DRAFT_1192576, partial [Melampsora americana]